MLPPKVAGAQLFIPPVPVDELLVVMPELELMPELVLIVPELLVMPPAPDPPGPPVSPPPPHPWPTSPSAASATTAASGPARCQTCLSLGSLMLPPCVKMFVARDAPRVMEPTTGGPPREPVGRTGA